MTIEEIIARLRVEGEGSFASALGSAGKSAEDAGQSAKTAGGGFGQLTKDFAVTVGGAAVLKKGFGYLKGATNEAGTLAKATAGLTRQTGMDAKGASAWVSMAKSRGIESKALTTSFTAYSKQLTAASNGSKGAADAMQKLGVDVEGLKNGTNDMRGSLSQVSEGFAAMPDGAEKSALAVKLFGKQGLSLLPILNKGSGALEEQMAAMDKAGLTMDKSGVEKSLSLAKSQREMADSMRGVKTSIGNALIPILATLAGALAPIIQGFASLVNKSPILATGVLVLGGALVGLLVVAKLASMLQAISAAMGILTGSTVAQTVAEWALNAAKAVGNALMAAGLWPILAIVAGFAALIAIIILVIKNWDAVSNAAIAAGNAILKAVKAVWNWIKGNWPLLLGILSGPIGLAVALIITHFDKVKAGFAKVKDAIKAGVDVIVSFFTSLPGKIASATANLFTSIINQAKDLPGQLLGAVGDIGSQLVDKITSPLKSVGNLLPFAQGGIVAAQSGLTAGRGTTALVGERGPEIMSLPSGTRITPLPPPALSASQLTGGGGRPVIAQVFLERRMIAEAMAAEVAERQAAR